MAATDPSTPAPALTVAPSRDGFRDTADSIIIAFILAFVFRAFVVEAFVIPTGSMAPTLYGRHGAMACENCGFTFAYGLLDASDHRPGAGHGPQSVAACPNCSFFNTHLVQNDKAKNSEAGDRILVLKWPLDTGIEALGPQRWDVTVFKDPSDGNTNFIKRLVGMPGEVLSIVDGDVYTVPTSELSPQARAVLEGRVLEKTGIQYDPPPGANLSHVPEAVLEELDQKLRITRKAPLAQESLWFNVYNHDYPPRTTIPSQPRWIAQRGDDSAWDVSDRTMRFDGASGPPESIELTNAMLVDAYAYNLMTPSDLHERNNRLNFPEFKALTPQTRYQLYGDNFVSDMRVRFVLVPRDDRGRLRVILEKAGIRLTGTVGMDGQVSIAGVRDNQPIREFESLRASLGVGVVVPREAVEVAFEVVDYRAALYLNGRQVLGTGDEHLRPDVRALRKGHRWPAFYPRIEGEEAAFELMHVVVERDVHYRNPKGVELSALPRWSQNLGGWASPANPMLLRPGEYFMLGDNSPQSQDSRLWSRIGDHLADRGEAFQLGTVPQDQLIGRAFFVYWPSGHRVGEWLPWVGKFGVIPDVGRMRWIR